MERGRIEILEKQMRSLEKRVKCIVVGTAFVAVGATVANLNLLGRSLKERGLLDRFDTPQAQSEELVSEESLNADKFEGNIVTGGELRLRVPRTNNFQRFEMPKDVEEGVK